MVIVHRNKKTGRLFLRTSIHGTGRHFTQQLNTAGEQRLLKAGVDVGHRLPGWLLQKLEEHYEVHPCLGIFGGQRSLDLDEIEMKRLRRSLETDEYHLNHVRHRLANARAA
ncbi:MAG TPA: hypothetical protein VG167_08680 [Verrucomicrobiae bacterium]|nr:hypothetical protein [Verrucomicrobiae bacterium]